MRDDDILRYINVMFLDVHGEKNLADDADAAADDD